MYKCNNNNQERRLQQQKSTSLQVIGVHKYIMYNYSLHVLAVDFPVTEEALDREKPFSMRFRLLSLGGRMAGASSTVDASKLVRPLTCSVGLERTLQYVDTRDL